jgi:hypothetical protein
VIEVLFLFVVDVNTSLKCGVERSEEAYLRIAEVLCLLLQLLVVEEEALTGDFDLALIEIIVNGQLLLGPTIVILLAYHLLILLELLPNWNQVLLIPPN